MTGADGGFKLASGRARRPDVAFLSKAHGILLEGIEFPIAPDLAVEVVSPDEDIFKKAREYLGAGTRIVWAVYADEQLVYQMTLNENGAILSLPFIENDMLSRGEVLLCLCATFSPRNPIDQIIWQPPAIACGHRLDYNTSCCLYGCAHAT